MPRAESVTKEVTSQRSASQPQGKVGAIAANDPEEQDETDQDDDGFFLGEIKNIKGKYWSEDIKVNGVTLPFKLDTVADVTVKGQVTKRSCLRESQGRTGPDGREAMGLIGKVDTPTDCCYPTVVVPKRNEKVRICEDFIQLNKAILSENQPVPTPEQTFGKQTGARDLIKQYRKSTELRANPKEPMIPSAVPDRPWQVVDTDISYVKKRPYLIFVDYFSKFIEVNYLASLTAAWNQRDGDMSKDVEVYRITVHLFSGFWSPSESFSLCRVEEDHKEKLPKTVVQTVDKNFYADDCLKSVDTVWEAMDIVHQFCNLLAVGGFRSTRWIRRRRHRECTRQDLMRFVSSVYDPLRQKYKIVIARPLVKRECWEVASPAIEVTDSTKRALRKLAIVKEFLAEEREKSVWQSQRLQIQGTCRRGVPVSSICFLLK
ncbi:hypothetical protein P5673_012090 [Acropora cervicornis]|uniref:Uncharacterized protein n=1 Tax=Acropora cervicornis TaxID=6130 RepID=A0AAD9QP92_ACRCE|nr:hypothetical protein P5673_012090 [Acropora cervicornis]